MIRWRFSGIGGVARGVLIGAVVSAVGAGLGGCACPSGSMNPALQEAPRTAPAPGRINHVVFFELDDPSDAPALIAEALELGQIPGVTSCYAGRHIDTGRDTVRQDYDVGFFVAFNSEEAYASYVSHPDHVALVEKWRPRLRAGGLRVYDVLDERETK